METFEKKHIPVGLVPMRTEVPYAKPSIYGLTGQLKSVTFWYPENYISCSLDITVYWVSGLGWTFRIELMTHWSSRAVEPLPANRERACVIDFRRRGEGHDVYFRDGVCRDLAGFFADLEAEWMVEQRGLKMPKLAPYVGMERNKYGDPYIPDYKKYLDAGIALNPIPFK